MRRLLYMLVAVMMLGALPAQAQDSETSAAEAPAGGPSVTDEDLMVTIQAPAGWKEIELQSNVKTVASFVHSGSESQIEVIAQRIVNQDVAQVFFETLRESLTSAEFAQVSPPQEATYGEAAGVLSEYSIVHTNVGVHVAVFSFVRNDVAYLVVGYFKKEERDQYFDAFKQTIATMVFS